LRDPSFLPLHDLPVQVDFLEECVIELFLRHEVNRTR
jgi:hypothetical protein